MLYPYRRSAVKNRQRWNFGVLYPRGYSEAQNGSDAWSMQTQCLVRGDAATAITTKVRFLQAVTRQIGRPPEPLLQASIAEEPAFELVDSLEVAGHVLQPWQEAVEQEVTLSAVRLSGLRGAPARREFTFSSGRELEPAKDETHRIVAFVVRDREELRGSVEVTAELCGEGLFRVTITLANLAENEHPAECRREDVLSRSLLSTHTVLGVTGGAFVSLLDPPADLQQAASECRNIGTWPVLIGDDHATDAMLSSPIVLYDYPQIAPESPGNLFDGTEIDEILALRILTLSDKEKREIRQTDDRAREVLERTENLPDEQFLKLHGVIRSMKRCDASGPGDGDK